jgi:phosphoribosyl 1,2-cyclic phosphate phosphodiesterase
MSRHRLTILGCGSSGGVPRIGNHWGACDPQEPRNRRRRCAVLVERFSDAGVTQLLVDTPPDVREQLLSVRVERLDAVLFTHDHADHTHGIDDLRMLAYNMRKRVDVFLDQPTLESLASRFAYCFDGKPRSSYPAILTARPIHPPQPFEVAGRGGPVSVVPIPQAHGDIGSLGFRIGDIAYSPDISAVPEESRALLEGLDVWIVDALRYVPHPSHFTVKQALGEIERVAPKRAILTHLHIDLDYNKLKRELPAHVEPAWDGMEVWW